VAAALSVEVRCGQRGSHSARNARAAQVRIRIADASLRSKVSAQIQASISRAVDEKAGVALPAAFAIDALRAVSRHGETLRGALALVDITDRSARSIRSLVAALESAGCAGVQLVYRKAGAMPAPTEAVVFGILEERRGQSDRTPVILTRRASPVEVWRHVLVAVTSASKGRNE
jgi:hypothetical protein